MIAALYVILAIMAAPWVIVFAVAWGFLLLKLLFIVLAVLAWPWLFVGVFAYDKWLNWKEKND